MRRPWLGLLLWLLLVAAFSGAGVWQLQHGARIDTNILSMLPKLQQDPLTQRAINRVEQQFSGQIYLALQAADKQTTVSAAQQLMQQLQASDAFSQVQSAPSELAALGKFYFPYRMRLLTAEQQQLLQHQQLDTLIQQAQQQLYNPFGTASSGLLSQDPLLLFPSWLQTLAAGQQFQQQDGILVKANQQQWLALVIAKGKGSAFNPDAQQQQLSALNDALESLPPAVTVLKAGALFHAAAATQSAKQEISEIGGISLLGVVLLVLWCFRSLTPLLVALLTLGGSFIAATVVTLTAFNGMHLLTLVFGTTLVGIAIDYSFHFYCVRLQSPELKPQQCLKQLMPTLTLALISSVIAYLALAFTPFPGMRQVALFCASGLVFTWLTLLLAYPALAGGRLSSSSRALALAGSLDQWLQRRRPKALLWWAAVLLIALGIVRLSSNDDIRQLQQSPAAITQEENQLRALLSGGTDNQFLLVRASDDEQLLQRLEQLSATLQTLITQGNLGSFVSLSRFVPSAATQADNYQLQATIYHALPDILPQLGLDEQLADTLLSQYQQSQPLTLRAWLAQPANQASGLAQLWLDDPQQQAAIVLLGGIKHLPQLQTLAQAQQGVSLVDKVADISSMMAHYRLLTLQLLGLTLAVAALLFIWRYGLRRGLAIAAVPIFAAVLTLGCLGWLGAQLTLFHSLALLLVFGIGVDYSLFFANARQHNAAVLLAVLLSALSTLLGFGLLGLSQTHAIAAFGQTIALGILFTLLLALQQSSSTEQGSDS
ncbi:MMPL family transporter [Shewanella sp. A3A]|nr:MMPL family transporter [Shewanella ferrihydritica]